MTGDLIIDGTILIESQKEASSVLFSPGITGIIGVLLGSVISGFFTYFGNNANNKILLQIKEKEVNSGKILLDAELKSSEELKKIELDHQKVIQQIEQKNKKEIRLLDEKIKIFTEFNYNFQRILSGTFEERNAGSLELAATLLKLGLFAPEIRREINDLRDQVIDYAIFCMGRGKERTQSENTILMNKMRPLRHQIMNKLSEILFN